MKKLFSVIIGLILVLIIIAGCRTAKDVTGEAVKTGQAAQPAVSCVDSDNGQDFYIKGNVTGSVVKKGADFCAVRSDMIAYSYKVGDLIEYYCKDANTSDYMAYTCPNGCKDGKCIEPIEPVMVLETVPETQEVFKKCQDSDKGRNTLLNGTISGTTIDPKTATDTCVLKSGKMFLIETYCLSDERGATLTYDCSKDKRTCKEGACVIMPPVNEAEDKPRSYLVMSDEVMTKTPGCVYGGSGNYKPEISAYIGISSGIEPAKPEFRGFIGKSVYEECYTSNRTLKVEYYCDSSGYAHKAMINCLHGCQKDKCNLG